MTEKAAKLLPASSDEGTANLVPLLPDAAPHQGGMAKTKPSKESQAESAPAESPVDQAISAIFSPDGMDIAKAMEIAATVLSQENMMAAALFGLSLGSADRTGNAPPPEVIEFLGSISAIFSDPEKFKDLRSKLRITQAELAEYLGVSRELIKAWESGQARLPPHAFKALLEIIAAKVTVRPLTGDQIAKLRKHLGISRASFAEAVGVSERSVVLWEKSGERSLTHSASAKVRDAATREEWPLSEALAA